MFFRLDSIAVTATNTMNRPVKINYFLVLINKNNPALVSIRGQDSSVGIATRYGLDGPGIESRGGEIFRTLPDQPWGLPSLLYKGYRVFPGGKAAEAWC